MQKLAWLAEIARENKLAITIRGDGSVYGNKNELLRLRKLLKQAQPVMVEL